MRTETNVRTNKPATSENNTVSLSQLQSNDSMSYDLVSNASVWDKLIFHTEQEINASTLKDLRNRHIKELGCPPKKSSWTGYDRTIYQLHDTPVIIIRCSHYLRLDINPNRYLSFNELEDFLGRLILNFDPKCAEVKACHFNIDLNASFDNILSSLIVKRKRKGCLFFKSSEKTGLSIGCRPNEYVIYNKGLEQKKSNAMWTRIERRYTGEHCPIKSLADVRNLLQLEPFAEVQLADIPYFNATTPSDWFKQLGVLSSIRENGAHFTYRKMSSSGQYQRDWEKYMQKVKSPALQAIYLKHIRKYLEG